MTKNRHKQKALDHVRSVCPVALYGGKYSLDVFGNVTNKKGLQLTPYKTPAGYSQYDLYDENSRRRRHQVHRLLAENYLPNPDQKPFVHHLDGDRSNNRLNNLEWATVSENNFHTWNEGGKSGRKSSSGEKFIYRELGRYVVRVTSKGNSIYVGMHKDLEQAVIMRDKFIEDYGEEL